MQKLSFKMPGVLLSASIVGSLILWGWIGYRMWLGDFNLVSFVALIPIVFVIAGGMLARHLNTTVDMGDSPDNGKSSDAPE